MNTRVLSSSVFNLDDYSVAPFLGAPVNWGGGWGGSGILGTYYSNNNFTGTSFQRADVRIDFPFTTVLPGGSLASDPIFGAVGATNFSVKWVGSLIPKYTRTYTLKVKTGGTLTLKINGSTVATSTSSSGWTSASYLFVVGQHYAVEVDMVQGTGAWCAQVHWLGTGLPSFPEEAIGPATPIGANFADPNSALANCVVTSNSYLDHYNGNPGPPVDTSGWPTGDFAVIQMSDSYSAIGVWTISFNGAADFHVIGNGLLLLGHDDGGGRTPITLNGKTYYEYSGYQFYLTASMLVWDATTQTGYDSTNNKTTVLFLLTTSMTFPWDNIDFRNTDRSGKGAPGGPSGTPAQNGLTNFVCMKPSSHGSTSSYSPGTVFTSPYLTAVAPYVCLRNNGYSYDLEYIGSVTTPYSDWSKRSTPVFNWIASNHNQFPLHNLPWEFHVMASNQAGKDLYINLPQTASGNPGDSDCQSSYIYQLANLIKNGSTFNGVNYPGLLPHLCVYIEYGNENWNYGLTGPYGSRGDVSYAVKYNKDANTLDWQQYAGMGGTSTIDGNGNPDARTILWNILKAKDASDIFRLFFGDSAMPGGPGGCNYDPRIRPLFEWQYKGDWNGEGFSAYSAFSTIQSHFGITINHVFWGGGGGWYSDNYTGGSTADQVFSNITLATAAPLGDTYQLPSGYTDSVQMNRDDVAAWGLHCVGYEGGFDFGGANPPDGQQQASNDTRIIPYVEQSLNQYFRDGGSLPLVFTAIDGWYGFVNRWTVIDSVWNCPPYKPAPPKLQAYLNCQQALPGQTVLQAKVQIPNGFRFG